MVYCTNTIADGFYFGIGKGLAELCLAVGAGVAIAAVAFVAMWIDKKFNKSS